MGYLIILTRSLMLTVSVFAVGACADDVTAPPPLPASELRATPTSITLAGETLVLEAYLYRDFEPPAPPNGRPLIAGLTVRTVDGSPFPSSVRADGAWVVFEDAVWATAVAEEQPRNPAASFYGVVARNGPKWGPGIAVDVIIRLREGDTEHRLRAANQPIRRTD